MKFASGINRQPYETADGFAADYDVLMKTAELLHKYVPSVETIGGYARIDNFYDKTEQQLRDMAAMGFADPYIGVESGDGKGNLHRIHRKGKAGGDI